MAAGRQADRLGISLDPLPAIRTMARKEGGEYKGIGIRLDMRFTPYIAFSNGIWCILPKALDLRCGVVKLPHYHDMSIVIAFSNVRWRIGCHQASRQTLTFLLHRIHCSDTRRNPRNATAQILCPCDGPTRQLGAGWQLVNSRRACRPRTE